MIDHVSIPVSDLARSSAFYEAALAPLGYGRLVSRDASVGFGKSYPEVWLNHRPGAARAPGDGGHLCLRARTEAAVRAFYDAALAHGGRSDGAPGPRSAAFTGYFAAFVLDPDGNRLEAASFPAPAPS
jgi:catechol 2,3-dioxygenase-like lactoylglutathione lyase family enzyme